MSTQVRTAGRCRLYDRHGCRLRRRIAIANLCTTPVLVGTAGTLRQTLTCSTDPGMLRGGPIPPAPANCLCFHCDH